MPVAVTAKFGGHSSVGRAPALQAGGRRFDPDRLHQVFGGRRFCLQREEKLFTFFEKSFAVFEKSFVC